MRSKLLSGFLCSLLLISSSILAQTSDDYRSKASGNWEDAATWEVYNGAAWVDAVGFPQYNTGNDVTVRSGHIVALSGGQLYIKQTTIEAGGTVNVPSGQTLWIYDGTGDDLTVYGTLINSYQIKLHSGTPNINVMSGGVFQQNYNGNNIPTIQWDSNATLEITGITTSQTGIFNSAVNYGNIIWNCAGQQNWYAIDNTLANNNVSGSFTVENTGTTYLTFTRADNTINFGGDFNITGGESYIAAGGNTITLSIGGNFNFSGGSFAPSTNSSRSVTIELTGSDKTINYTNTNEAYTNWTIAGTYTLLSDLEVAGTLSMNSGSVTTGANTLTLGHSTSTLGTLSYTDGKIIGNIKRWFSNAAVSNILFPIGTAADYYPASLSFTSAPSSGGTLTCMFSDANPGSNGLPLDDGGSTIENAGTDGYWTLTASDGLSGGTYNLDLTANGFSGVQDYTSLVILKRNIGGSWVVDGNHSAGTGSNLSPVAHRTGMTGFSEFGIGGTSTNPLPVELIGFSAEVDGNSVKLKWQTATELNNYGWEVQKQKQNDSKWETINFISGKGNSNSTNQYSYIEENISSGSFCYRLKQIDINGEFNYSKIVNVEIEQNSFSYKLEQNYPNPFNPTTKIKYSISKSGFVSLKVFNVSGELVRTLVNANKDAGNYEISFDAEGLSSGVYFYSIQSGDFIKVNKMILIK